MPKLNLSEQLHLIAIVEATVIFIDALEEACPVLYVDDNETRQAYNNAAEILEQLLEDVDVSDGGRQKGTYR